MVTLGRAENQLSVSTEANLVGSYHQAALAHHTHLILRHLGDLSGAERQMIVSNRARPPGERRSRAISTAMLAETQLDQGHLEQACATWSKLLDDAAVVRSGRVVSAITTMRQRLRPYLANPIVRALDHRAVGVLAPTSGAPNTPRLNQWD